MVNKYRMRTTYKELLEEYPFLTVVEYAGKEYLGIIQNIDTHVASMYVYDRLVDKEHKILFLELGEEWWWETNRKLPINIALLNRWNFQHCIMSFNVKQMEIVSGPEVRLANCITKRIKRRNISLLKKNP